MTAYISLGLIVLGGLGMVVSYGKGVEHTENRLRLEQTQIDLAISRAVNKSNDEVLNRVNEAVQNVRIENKTYVRNFKEVEKQSVVYRECQHTDDAFRLLNSALRGDPLPSQPSLSTDVSN